MRTPFRLAATTVAAGTLSWAHSAYSAEGAARTLWPPCDGVYAIGTETSDYRSDGFSESDLQPTVRANIHCFRSDDYYVGLVYTGVNFQDTPRTRTEVDVYGGKHFTVGGGDLNLGVLYTSFPDKKAPGPSYNILEPLAEYTYPAGPWTFIGKTGVSPNVTSRIGARRA